MTDLDGLSKEEITALLVRSLEEASEAISELFPRMHKRPLLGGVFGSAGFRLCSYCYTSNGLQEVRYYLFSEHGLFLGVGERKADAIKMGRAFLLALDSATRTGLLEKYRARVEQQEAEVQRQIREAEAEVAALRAPKQKVRSIGRRRERIFNESGGKCHYCETTLTLDGKWHIEHKMPKALGGDNQPGNLVASCVSCNHKKRDTTDLEFKAKLAKEKSA